MTPWGLSADELRAGQIGHVITLDPIASISEQHDVDRIVILSFVLYNISYSIGLGIPYSVFPASAQKHLAPRNRTKNHSTIGSAPAAPLGI